MGVNITTIVYLRVLIIQIGSTIILMVVEAQGNQPVGEKPSFSKPPWLWVQNVNLVGGFSPTHLKNMRTVKMGECLPQIEVNIKMFETT